MEKMEESALNQHWIASIDCSADFSRDKWRALLERGYQCQVVGSGEEAVRIVAIHRVDAIARNCSVAVAAVKGVMHTELLRGEAPVFLLCNNKETFASELEEIDFVIETVPSMTCPAFFLCQHFATTGKSPVALYHYEAAPLHWPFAVLTDHDGEVVRFEGATVTLSKRGMVGRVDEALKIGETVLVEFPECPPYRAQVHCRYQDVYGFVFKRHLGIFAHGFDADSDADTLSVCKQPQEAGGQT